jgi:hypothetical protein
LIFLRSGAEETLGVQTEELFLEAEGSADAKGAGIRLGRFGEYFVSFEEQVVQGVRLSFARVAKNRDHLDLRVWRTSQPRYELVRR